jgi:hypothetical protein
VTIISVPSPYGFTTFFDDLRQEINGKFIYSGVYTNGMLVQTLPYVIPTFVALVTYRERPGENYLPVTIKMFVPGIDDPVITMPLPMEQLRKAPFDDSIDYEGLDKIISAQMPLMISPLVITAEGVIRVRAYRGDDEIRIGALRILLAQPPRAIPSANVPPQS